MPNKRSFRTEMYATKVGGEKVLVGWIDWNVPITLPDTFVVTNAIEMENKLIEHFISFNWKETTGEEVKEEENTNKKEFPKQLSFWDSE